MSGVLDSQRAWVGHGAMHDDSPPRRLPKPEPRWEGEPFQEETFDDDDWRYDDPIWGTYVPAENPHVVFDSRDGTLPDEFDPEEQDDPWADGPYGDL
jgi:hypothetical protein